MIEEDRIMQDVYIHAERCAKEIYRNSSNSDITYWLNAQYELHQYILSVGYQKNLCFDKFNMAESNRRRVAAQIMEAGLADKQSATKLEGLMAAHPDYITAKELERHYEKRFNQFKTLWADLKDLFQMNIMNISVLKQDNNFNQYLKDKE